MSVAYKALSSMEIEMRRQESIARNMSGASLPGYKGEVVLSSDFDGYVDKFSESGQGTVFDSQKVDYDPGAIKHTNRPLDFALSGKGFFEVTTDKGDVLYTRNGRFRLSNSGEIQTAEGYKLSSTGGDLSFGESDNLNELIVKENGDLALRSSTGEKSIGTLKIVNIEDTSKLQRLSASYFNLAAKDQNLAEEMEAGEFQISGRSIEMANISAVKEMITMVSSMRRFEMAQRVMKMSDGLRNKEHQTFS